MSQDAPQADDWHWLWDVYIVGGCLVGMAAVVLLNDRAPGNMPLAIAALTGIIVCTLQTSALLVDDHPVVREGLRGMIDAEHDRRVVGEAGSGAEAIALAESLSPMSFSWIYGCPTLTA
jgi:hypothetical protein